MPRTSGARVPVEDREEDVEDLVARDAADDEAGDNDIPGVEGLLRAGDIVGEDRGGAEFARASRSIE